MLQCDAVCQGALPCVTVCCRHSPHPEVNVLHTATQTSSLWVRQPEERGEFHRNTLCTATYRGECHRQGEVNGLPTAVPKVKTSGYVLRCVEICVAVCRSASQCVAVCCSVLQCVAGCRRVSQCVAVCRSVSQCVAVRRSVSQCDAVCRSVSQCVTEYCSLLQSVAVCVVTD